MGHRVMCLQGRDGALARARLFFVPLTCVHMTQRQGNCAFWALFSSDRHMFPAIARPPKDGPPKWYTIYFIFKAKYSLQSFEFKHLPR